MLPHVEWKGLVTVFLSDILAIGQYVSPWLGEVMEKSHKEGGVYRYFSQLGEVFYQGMEEFMYSKSILSV